MENARNIRGFGSCAWPTWSPRQFQQPSTDHKRPSHSWGPPRSHSKVWDKEHLPISEAIMTERYVTAQTGNTVPPGSPAIPSFRSRRWKLVVDGAQSGRLKGPGRGNIFISGLSDRLPWMHRGVSSGCSMLQALFFKCAEGVAFFVAPHPPPPRLVGGVMAWQ